MSPLDLVLYAATIFAALLIFIRYPHAAPSLLLTLFFLQTVMDKNFGLGKWIDELALLVLFLAAAVLRWREIWIILRSRLFLVTILLVFVLVGLLGNFLGGTLDWLAFLGMALALKWFAYALALASLVMPLPLDRVRQGTRLFIATFVFVFTAQWLGIAGGIVSFASGNDVPERFGLPIFSGLLGSANNASQFFLYSFIVLLSVTAVYGPSALGRVLLLGSIVGMLLPLRRRIAPLGFVAGTGAALFSLRMGGGVSKFLGRWAVLPSAAAAALTVWLTFGGLGRGAPPITTYGETENPREARGQLLKEASSREVPGASPVIENLFGSGFGTYASIGARLRDASNADAVVSNPGFLFDNAWATYIGETGFLGAMLFFLALTSIWLHSAKRWFISERKRSSDERQVNLALLLLIPVITVQLLFTHAINQGFGLLVTSFLLAFSLYHSARSDQKKA